MGDERKLKMLEAPYCPVTEKFYIPKRKGQKRFIDEVMTSGEEIEASCPSGGRVTISRWRDNGDEGIQFDCRKCNRTIRA